MLSYFSALISAFDKAKKKYQAKLKKLEAQMQSLTERYESQVSVSALNITHNYAFPHKIMSHMWKYVHALNNHLCAMEKFVLHESMHMYKGTF